MQIDIGQDIDANALRMQEAQQAEIDRKEMRRSAERIEIVVAQRRQWSAETRERDTAAIVMGVIERGQLIGLGEAVTDVVAEPRETLRWQALIGIGKIGKG